MHLSGAPFFVPVRHVEIVTVHSVHSNVAKNSFQIACGNGILACMSRDFGIFMPKTPRGIVVCEQ